MSAVRLEHQLRALTFGGRPSRSARFRRRDRRARSRATRSSSRCRPMPRRRSCAVSTCRPSSAPSSTRISASIRRQAQPPIHRRHQRHDRMDLRIPRPVVGDDQRRRSADRYAARAACERRSGARSRGCPDCRPHCRRGRSCASGARPSPPRPRRTPGARAQRPSGVISLLAGDWTDTGLPATIESAIRSGNRAADARWRSLP